jgi:hypothetical protein
LPLLEQAKKIGLKALTLSALAGDEQAMHD